jgi:chaperone modulatory protein CbpM
MPTDPIPEPLIVERDISLSLTELYAACDGESVAIDLLIDEGVLVPHGEAREAWHFGGASLARARTAVRLMRDLEVNGPGVALALQLLDEIAALRARLDSND